MCFNKKRSSWISSYSIISYFYKTDIILLACLRHIVNKYEKNRRLLLSVDKAKAHTHTHTHTHTNTHLDHAYCGVYGISSLNDNK